MGNSRSFSEKCPTERESKATNDGFAKKTVTNVHTGSTIDNGGGRSFRGDVRKGGKSSGGVRSGMPNTY